MSATLYRKYRPQKFSDLVGQNHIKITLQNEIKTNKLAHAFIFAGPRGVGKTTTARILAKAINCQDNEKDPTEPCNSCSACQEITGSRALDVVEIDAASHTGVDNVRENIITTAKLSPARLKYRVFIIDEVHMLSISAFNALLKILEEPPKNVIFILATTEIHKVPVTIISRCQRFDFKRVSAKEIVNLLATIAEKEKVIIEKKVLETIARMASGSVRDAESILGQIISLGEKKIGEEEASLILPRSDFGLNIEFLKHLSKKEIPQAIGFVNKIVFEGVSLNQFTVDLIEILRKTLLQKIGSNLEQFSLELDETLEKEIINLNQKLTIDDIMLMIEVFSRRKIEIKFAEIPHLPLEMAVIEIAEQLAGLSVQPQEPPRKETKEEATKEKKVTKHQGLILLSLDEAKNQWQAFLAEMKATNYSLFSFLKTAQFLSCQDNTLEIGLTYKFHLEKVRDIKNKLLIEKMLEKIFGQKMQLEAKLIEDNNQFLDNLAQSFGGQVLD